MSGTWRDNMRKAVRSGDPEALALVPHGTTTGYGYGCRCQPCIAARNAYEKAARDARRGPARRERAALQERALAIYAEEGPSKAARTVGVDRQTVTQWARDAGLVLAPRELQPCGTRAAYVRHLRHKEAPCAPCVEANRAGTAERVADLKRRASAGELPIPHGTTVGYSYRGCRCSLCTEANRRSCWPYASAYRERQKAKRVTEQAS